MFGNKKKDVNGSIKSITSAIRKEGSFKKFSDKQVLKYIMEEAKAVASFLSHYLIEDSMYIHGFKKNLLSDVIRELNQLVASCNHDYNYLEFDKLGLSNLILQIQSIFEEYSQYGSFYVFRHCEKVKRTDAMGTVYDGIPTHAIKSQAMKRAKEIINEIFASPKEVKIVVFHSEAKRTQIFADILLREITIHCQSCKDKIQIVKEGYAPGIRFGYFTSEALNEMLPIYKSKGEFYAFINWYNNTNEFKDFKSQPKPSDVISGVNDFVTKKYDLTLDKDFYTIVLGFTHSWVIDSYLLHKIPELENQVKNIIKTAAFFKVECGEMNYLGRHVKI